MTIVAKTILTRNVSYTLIAAVVIAAVAIVAVYYTAGESNSVSVSIRTNATPVIYPYQTTGLTINITDTGSLPLTDLPVVLYANSGELHSYSISLAPHKSTQITYAYTYYAGPGSYEFSAVADPAMLLKLNNRNGSSSTARVNVTAAAVPDVYTSVPNNGIMYTQRFSTASTNAQGLAYASVFTKYYNISFFNALFGNKVHLLPMIISDLGARITTLNGAYISYPNNESAYVVWVQGPLTQHQASTVIGTFSLRSYDKNMSNSSLSAFVIDNHTSICVAYEAGWTKIVEYSNASSGTMCAALAGTYTPLESNAIVNALRASNAMVNAAPNFVYSNSSPLLYSIVYSNTEFGIDSLFTNQYGVFLSNLAKNSSGAEQGTHICHGLTYNSNGISACSTYITSISNASALGFALINTTSITGNYTLSLYSLVNQSEAVAAHYAGASLIRSLGFSNSTVHWSSSFNNTCSFHNASIGCSVESFNYSDQQVALNITNIGGNSIILSGLACYAYVASAATPFTVDLPPESHAVLDVPCVALAAPFLGTYNSYMLNLTYTHGENQTAAVNGTLKVTNFIS